jgi:hypothetical protein
MGCHENGTSLFGLNPQRMSSDHAVQGQWRAAPITSDAVEFVILPSRDAIDLRDPLSIEKGRLCFAQVS